MFRVVPIWGYYLDADKGTGDPPAPESGTGDGTGGGAGDGDKKWFHEYGEGLEVLSGYESVGDAVKDLTKRLSDTPSKVEDVKVPLADGSDATGPMVEAFKGMAVSAGLTKSQIKEVVKFWNGQVMMSVQNAKESVSAATESLKAEWAGAFESNVKKAKDVVTKFGGNDFRKFLDDSGLGNHPTMVSVMHKIAVALGEDKLVIGDSKPGGENKGITRSEGGTPQFKYDT